MKSRVECAERQSLQEHVIDTLAQPPRGHRLRADLADLAVAFDEAPLEMNACLDLDTGKLICLRIQSPRIRPS